MAMEITRANIIWGLIGSAVFATIVGVILTWVKEAIQSKNRKKEERNENLYRPLFLYFTIIESTIKTGAFLLESRITSGSGIPDEIDSDRWLKITGETSDSLTENRWEYTRKILKTLEENPQYIKKQDWPLVEKLFTSHIFKRVISGEENWKGISSAFGVMAKKKDDENEFIKILDQLHERVKKQVKINL